MEQPFKLGHAFEIVVTTRDLEESLGFYERLGYRKLSEDASPTPSARLTDGTIRLTLRAGGAWKATLTYYAEDVAEKVAALRRLGVPVEARPDADGRITRVAFTDPNGLEVNVIQAGPAQLEETPNAPLSKGGQFGELSIETEDVGRSLDFWTKLGFAPTQYMPNPPVSWGSVADGLLMLGIYAKGHCPHVIRTPSLTYFEADMPERIRQLKQEGMKFLQELPGEGGETGHAIAEAPEGQLIFLFGF